MAEQEPHCQLVLPAGPQMRGHREALPGYVHGNSACLTPPSAGPPVEGMLGGECPSGLLTAMEESGQGKVPRSPLRLRWTGSSWTHSTSDSSVDKSIHTAVHQRFWKEIPEAIGGRRREEEGEEEGEEREHPQIISSPSGMGSTHDK